MTGNTLRVIELVDQVQMQGQLEGRVITEMLAASVPFLVPNRIEVRRYACSEIVVVNPSSNFEFVSVWAILQ